MIRLNVPITPDSSVPARIVKSSRGNVRNEQELISVALALLGPDPKLSPPEIRISRRIRPETQRPLVNKFRKAILAGLDPLGDTFSSIRSPQMRRTKGATYTPKAIVQSMVRWAATQGTPVRVIDPGAGSGRFLIAAARRFPKAKLIAIEIDPLGALILRANLAVLGLARRTSVLISDYRAVDLPSAEGATLFLGNPPYVRHHDIAGSWKEWFADASANLGVRASRLAGLHVHFFVKTMQLSKDGDFGVFITSAEWLDVNYGAALRQLLADGLGGISLHVLDPRAMPFEDAATTGAITCFRVGKRPASLIVRSVDSVSALGSLSSGTPVPWADLESSRRWSMIIRPGPSVPSGFMELGEICRVHRGQVTGSNRVWIAGPQAAELPAKVLEPTVTKARELLKANGTLRDSSSLRRVINLPEDLAALDPESLEAVKRFLEWAQSQGADKTYIAQHRRAWWAVNLKAPAPIICTYMARRSPAFVRNLCAARHINIAHGLYPREPLADHVLDALAAWLTKNIGTEGGRTYAGGLIKFEPKELERIQVPRLENLHA